MALTTDDAKPPGGHYLIVQLEPIGLDGIGALFLFFIRQLIIKVNFIQALVDSAAQNNIGTATCHVGRNRHDTGASGLENDLRFAFVLLGV